jgi:hypothetical protein
MEGAVRINAKPVKVRATLLVYFADLTPEHITDILKLTPDKAFVRGEQSPNRSKSKLIGSWHLSSPSVNSDDPNDHLEDLTSRLANKHKEIERLIELGCDVYIDCRIGIEHWNTAVDLSVRVLAALAKLSIPLRLDIYDEQTNSSN